jgi:hypothetical protein
MSARTRRRKDFRWLLAASVGISAVISAACSRDGARLALETHGQALEAPAAPDPRLAALGELSFVPVDAAAVVRVDLADVAGRSPEPEQSLKVFDFVLRAQQPAAWQALHAAGIGVGRELGRLYLVASPAGELMVAGLGEFDAARLTAGFEKSGAVATAGAGDSSIFTWRRAPESKLGANERPDDAPAMGATAVAVAKGVLLFGPPSMVRAALAARAGGGDVRAGALASELTQVDAKATIWGAARAVPGLVPGLERAHFHAVLAAPGRDLDGLFALRAVFASAEEAKAAGDKLRSALAAARLMGGRSPLGATLDALHKNAKVTVEDKTLVASASL